MAGRRTADARLLRAARRGVRYLHDPRPGRRRNALTTAPGLDDGPDYAPDGRVCFNSVRTGVMKIWRMDRTEVTRRR